MQNFSACKELKVNLSMWDLEHFSRGQANEFNFISCMLGNFACFLFSSVEFFQTQIFLKIPTEYQMSSSWDPDQAWHFVRPVLGPNCLQRLSADDLQVKS